MRIGHPAGPGRTAAAHAIVRRLRGTSRSRDDIVRDQWHKLLWNAGFNAICAVTGATAGEALATPGLGAAGARGDVGGRRRRRRATA